MVRSPKPTKVSEHIQHKHDCPVLDFTSITSPHEDGYIVTGKDLLSALREHLPTAGVREVNAYAYYNKFQEFVVYEGPNPTRRFYNTREFFAYEEVLRQRILAGTAKRRKPSDPLPEANYRRPPGRPPAGTPPIPMPKPRVIAKTITAKSQCLPLLFTVGDKKSDILLPGHCADWKDGHFGMTVWNVTALLKLVYEEKVTMHDALWWLYYHKVGVRQWRDPKGKIHVVYLMTSPELVSMHRRYSLTYPLGGPIEKAVLSGGVE